MNHLKKIAAAIALATCASVAPAQQPLPAPMKPVYAPDEQSSQQQQPARQQAKGQAVVQDGIVVRPMSRLRVLTSERQIEQQSKQQYLSMMQQAQQKNMLVPAEHPETIRLRNIAKRIIPYTARWNPAASKWEWQVNLINSEQVNAFCMPGGRVGVFTGIITKLKLTDDEIAAILGHEIAHALREHGREQMGKSMATNVGARLGGALLSAILGVDPGLTDTVARYGAQFASLKFSRDDEREADLIGLDLSARAGFDPRAGVVLWQKMAASNKGAPPAWLSTHPGGTERIRQMNEHMDVLLPLYARAKGTSERQLPPYRTTAMN
ncbi:MAG: M48 family metallopeptidase [Bdellovibrionales bacterium]|nr:M48 family metallopeptidase [Massilia sp.]